MSATTWSLDLANLLHRTGACPPRYGRGKWNCGRCGGRGCLSVDLNRGLFHCFHDGCKVSGNAGRLARELGLTIRLAAPEYRELRQNREKADRAARVQYKRVQSRRFELLEELRALIRLELRAHEARK